MSSTENAEEFNELLNDLKPYIISLELINNDSNFKFKTEGTTDNEYSVIKKLAESETPISIPSIFYDNLKYMHLKNINEEGRLPVYIYISTDVDDTGNKRGMFITCFFSFSFIATFEHKKINIATSKIISLIDQYQADE
ncbi:hypothetical protein NAPIS_ORF00825 [Vairimorpha apis BRL 01]|uniref:Uncharacterized protein n=1 Tax=Vairimorpha apis BRL 01 TaxID=1037528 RepID=T0MKS5_9MICR|nr:hypothetical protein NAPIS_ORF00825 [Vairimorpha apis BRL 01]